MSESPQKFISFSDFVFEVGSNLLRHNGDIIPLEPMAGRVLSYLLENGGRVISKNELLNAVWHEVFTTEDVLKRAVSQIRRALGDDANKPRFIETHHRRGYRFILADNANDGNESPEQKITLQEPNFDCFVGRDVAINALQTEFYRVVRGQGGQPILLSGEPGIGKTKTANRFVEWAQKSENVLSLRVRFFDYEASYIPPFNLFLDLLGEGCANIFGKSEDLQGLVREKMGVNLPEDLFSGTDGGWRASGDASRIIAPLAESFVRLSRLRPLILLLDDIQWADETSRRIIGYLMRVATDAPLMIVGSTRRAEAENSKGPFAGWLQTQASYRSFTTLDLSPLSPEHYRELINEVFRGGLDVATISDKDLLKLHSATGGNPYFTVETLRLLLNNKVIEKISDGWIWHGISDVPLPETVRMAARAKLANLSAEAHGLIECAAVLGDAFEIATLEKLFSDDGKHPDNQNFEDNLDEAIRAQILSEQNVSGTDDCQFYHTTLRRAVYMDLSPRRRRRLHARAAHAIECVHAYEIERVAAALGSHWENAADFRLSYQWNMQACRASANRFDWGEAAEILNRVERVTEKLREAFRISDVEMIKFLSLRGEVYMSVGRRVEAEKVLLEAVATAEKIGDTDESAHIFLNLGRTCILLGRYRDAIPYLEKSLELSTNHDLTCAARIQLASATYGLCEYEKSCEILQKIVAEEPSTSYNRAVALGKLGWTRALQSRYAEAKKLLEEALHFHDTVGDLRERAVLAMCLNTAEHGTGNYESAISYANRARAEAQIIGEPYNESMAMMRIARSRIAQGLFDEAEKLLLAVQEKQKSLESAHASAETLWMLGRVSLEKGDYETAGKNMETARQIIIEVGDKDDEFQILHDQSRLQIRLGNFSEAISFAEEAAKIAAEIGVEDGIGESLVLKAEAFSAQNNSREAVKLAREAAKILERFTSGERWQAHYALAKASKSDKEVETSLRRTVDILDKIRGELKADDLRFAQSTQAFKAPANDLRDFLFSTSRKTEALEISRSWGI